MTDIRYALDRDLPSLRSLWDVCFPQDQHYAPFFFSEIYKPEQALVLTCDGRLTAMLHMLPYALRLPDGDKKACYIYAVGTHPDFRRRGFSAGLLDQAFFEMHLRGVTYAMLIPAQPPLFDFYARFGFHTVFFHQPLIAKNVDFSMLPKACDTDVAELNRRYERHMGDRAYVRRSERDWLVLLRELALWGGGFSLLADGGYLAFDGKGKLWEGFGGDLVPDGAPRPLGMLRVIRARDAGWPHGVNDDMCPWNDGGSPPVLTPPELAARLVAPDAYMNLMHN